MIIDHINDKKSMKLLEQLEKFGYNYILGQITSSMSNFECDNGIGVKEERCLFLGDNVIKDLVVKHDVFNFRMVQRN